MQVHTLLEKPKKLLAIFRVHIPQAFWPTRLHTHELVKRARLHSPTCSCSERSPSSSSIKSSGRCSLGAALLSREDEKVDGVHPSAVPTFETKIRRFAHITLATPCVYQHYIVSAHRSSAVLLWCANSRKRKTSRLVVGNLALLGVV